MMTVSPVVGSVSPLQFAAVPHTFVPAPLSHVRVVCEKRSGAASRANARAVARESRKRDREGEEGVRREITNLQVKFWKK